MTGDWVARIFANQLTVFILIGVLMLAFAEAGFRLGLRLHSTNDVARKEQIGGIQGAVLGLLGLLLGFTFAMAVERYDTRRELVLQEANALATTYLRTSLLSDAHQTPVKDLLGRYVETRLKYWPLVDDPIKRAEGTQLIAELQIGLWKHASDAAKEAPNDTTAMFIESVNNTIDIDAKRIAAMRAGIPGGVWLLLFVVALFGCATTSYGSGAEGVRTKLGSLFLPLLIAVVIVLIFDIAHPRVGAIQISQDALVDLQQSIQAKELRNQR